MVRSRWPSRVARVTDDEPNLDRTSSRAASRAPRSRRSNGRASCTASASSSPVIAMPDERDAPLADQRAGGDEEVAHGPEDRARRRRRLDERAGAGGPGEVAEAQPEHHGAADPPGPAQPAADPVDEPGHDPVGLARSCRATRGRTGCRSNAGAARSPPGGGRGPTPWRGGGGRRGRRGWRARASGGICASSPTRWMPRSCSFAAVFGPTPHSRSIGSGWRNASSSPGSTTSSPSGLPTWLATFATDLVRATPMVMGRSTSARTRARSRLGDLDGRCR